MATLHIRGFPGALHRRLLKLADQERRSLSAEVTVLLERGLTQFSKPQREVLEALNRWHFRPSQQKIPLSLELLKTDRRR